MCSTLPLAWAVHSGGGGGRRGWYILSLLAVAWGPAQMGGGRGGAALFSSRWGCGTEPRLHMYELGTKGPCGAAVCSPLMLGSCPGPCAPRPCCFSLRPGCRPLVQDSAWHGPPEQASMLCLLWQWVAVAGARWRALTTGFRVWDRDQEALCIAVAAGKGHGGSRLWTAPLARPDHRSGLSTSIRSPLAACAPCSQEEHAAMAGSCSAQHSIRRPWAHMAVLSWLVLQGPPSRGSWASQPCYLEHRQSESSDV